MVPLLPSEEATAFHHGRERFLGEQRLTSFSLHWRPLKIAGQLAAEGTSRVDLASILCHFSTFSIPMLAEETLRVWKFMVRYAILRASQQSACELLGFLSDGDSSRD